MNEMVTGYQATLSLLVLTAACFLYMLGGRSGKWRRRFIGSLILSCGINGLCLWRGIWSPWFLLTYPALAIGFSMGYGATGEWMKVIRRSVYALGVLSAGLVMAIVLGGTAWLVFVPHVGVGLWSIWLGTKNPIEASAEEVFICALLNIGLMMYPFIGA